MGSAPAPGAAGRALAACIERNTRKEPVRYEGVPNYSRGGCAPPILLPHGSGSEVWPLAKMGSQQAGVLIASRSDYELRHCAG